MKTKSWTPIHFEYLDKSEDYERIGWSMADSVVMQYTTLHFLISLSSIIVFYYIRHRKFILPWFYRTKLDKVVRLSLLFIFSKPVFRPLCTWYLIICFFYSAFDGFFINAINARYMVMLAVPIAFYSFLYCIHALHRFTKYKKKFWLIDDDDMFFYMFRTGTGFGTSFWLLEIAQPRWVCEPIILISTFISSCLIFYVIYAWIYMYKLAKRLKEERRLELLRNPPKPRPPRVRVRYRQLPPHLRT